MTTKTSLYQLHKARWRDGCGSDECGGARTRVLCRGSLPCDVLFVGEGPGESEDVLGKPFVGPAGQLLDGIVDRALGYGPEIRVIDGKVDAEVRWALTNLVACIPREEDGGKSTEPSWEQQKACRGRLEELIRIADPRLIVAVGTHAKKALEQGFKDSVKMPHKIPVLAILHPAYILRQPIAQRDTLVQRCVVQISNAVEDIQ